MRGGLLLWGRGRRDNYTLFLIWKTASIGHSTYLRYLPRIVLGANIGRCAKGVAPERDGWPPLPSCSYFSGPLFIVFFLLLHFLYFVWLAPRPGPPLSPRSVSVFSYAEGFRFDWGKKTLDFISCLLSVFRPLRPQRLSPICLAQISEPATATRNRSTS